jgi:hypothetical protein
MEQMTLAGFLAWLVSTAGAAAATFWLMENVPWLKSRPAEAKRYLSLAIAGAVPVLAGLAMIGLGYNQAPAAWQGWLEMLFALAAPAIIASQGVHGALVLRKKSVVLTVVRPGTVDEDGEVMAGLADEAEGAEG